MHGAISIDTPMIKGLDSAAFVCVSSKQLGIHVSASGEFCFEQWINRQMVLVSNYRIIPLQMHSDKVNFTLWRLTR